MGLKKSFQKTFVVSELQLIEVECVLKLRMCFEIKNVFWN